MKKTALLVLLSAFVPVLKAQAITHEQACGNRFFPAVIPIKADNELGTGFIVSSDGWIVTAAHVVINSDTKQAAKSIVVGLPGSKDPVSVRLVSSNDAYTQVHDFAFLKADSKDLPFLTLGDENVVGLGSDLTTIGFPFSATNGIPIRFCLADTAASWFTETTPVGKFNIVFFQGPSIKGISGSPVISNETGTVIGMSDASLAGLTAALKQQERLVQAAKGRMQMTMGGVNFFDTIGGILDVIDNQIANGLGVAIGAKDIADKLAEVQKQEAANTAK